MVLIIFRFCRKQSNPCCRTVKLVGFVCSLVLASSPNSKFSPHYNNLSVWWAWWAENANHESTLRFCFCSTVVFRCPPIEHWCKRFFLQVCFAEKEDDKHQIDFFPLFSPFSIGSRHFPDFFSLDFWLTIIFLSPLFLLPCLPVSIAKCSVNLCWMCRAHYCYFRICQW